jgi:LacI family transcriptional regulator
MRQAGKIARKAVLIVLDLSYQSAREQLAGIYHFQQMQSNWDISLIPSNDPRFQPTILQSISGNVDGAIVKIGSALDMNPIMLSKKLPLVILEKPAREQIKALGPNRPFAVIGINNEKVGGMAADYLSNLGNFASYLFIHDPNNNEWSRLRGLSFKSAMRKRHHRVQILSLEDFERKLPAMETPMAIFVAFDLLATNVLKVCRKANLSIPGDAVVLSVDNDSALCENTSPTLSSIRLAHENLGYSAAKALNALMAGKRIKTIEELPPLDVIVRNSTTYLPPARLLVERAMRIIEDNKAKGIRVTDIARQLGVSPSLLKLRFHQTRNCSLRDTLIATRLDEVTRLLKTSDYPIGQIAKMCGFSSSVVLNHLFRKKFGTSPHKWRAGQQ